MDPIFYFAIYVKQVPLLVFDISAMIESCGNMISFVAMGKNSHNITMVARRGKIVRDLNFVQQICGSLQ
jgi:plastocyanin